MRTIFFLRKTLSCHFYVNFHVNGKNLRTKYLERMLPETEIYKLLDFPASKKATFGKGLERFILFKSRVVEKSSV